MTETTTRTSATGGSTAAGAAIAPMARELAAQLLGGAGQLCSTLPSTAP